MSGCPAGPRPSGRCCGGGTDLLNAEGPSLLREALDRLCAARDSNPGPAD